VDDFGQRLTLLVAQRVQALRKERGWSLEALAAAAGLHRTTVGLVVRGERGLTLASAGQLAVALDVRLSELVAEAEVLLAVNDQRDAEGP
jgi:transcriptional regulator with XRE-family HTH domain